MSDGKISLEWEVWEEDEEDRTFTGALLLKGFSTRENASACAAKMFFTIAEAIDEVEVREAAMGHA